MKGKNREEAATLGGRQILILGKKAGITITRLTKVGFPGLEAGEVPRRVGWKAFYRICGPLMARVQMGFSGWEKAANGKKGYPPIGGKVCQGK